MFFSCVCMIFTIFIKGLAFLDLANYNIVSRNIQVWNLDKRKEVEDERRNTSRL